MVSWEQVIGIGFHNNPRGLLRISVFAVIYCWAIVLSSGLLVTQALRLKRTPDKSVLASQ